MYGSYYKLPLDFKEIIEKKDLEKISLENSIAQYIELALTTHFGECKFDGRFGCKIWEVDFDLLTDASALRDKVKKYVKETVSQNEQRLNLTEVEAAVTPSQTKSYNGATRIKKKINLTLHGFIKQTNRSLIFSLQFFIGPYS